MVVQKHNKPQPIKRGGQKQAASGGQREESQKGGQAARSKQPNRGILMVYVSLWEPDPERNSIGRIWAYLPVDDVGGQGRSGGRGDVPAAQREKVTFGLVSEARDWAREYGYTGIKVQHAKYEEESTRRAIREGRYVKPKV